MTVQVTHTNTLSLWQCMEIYVWYVWFILISSRALMRPAEFMQPGKAPLIPPRARERASSRQAFTAAELAQTLFSLKLVRFYSLCRFLLASAADGGGSWLFSMFLWDCLQREEKAPHRLGTRQDDAAQQTQSSGSTLCTIRASFTDFTEKRSCFWGLLFSVVPRRGNCWVCCTLSWLALLVIWFIWLDA